MGLHLEFIAQPAPLGLAHAFVLGREFVGDDNVTLILGDNIFYGHGLAALLRSAAARKRGATVFGYYVREPQRYGVVEFDAAGNPVSITEKTAEPASHYAVTGLCFDDTQVWTLPLSWSLPRVANTRIPISTMNTFHERSSKFRSSRGVTPGWTRERRAHCNKRQAS